MRPAQPALRGEARRDEAPSSSMQLCERQCSARRGQWLLRLPSLLKVVQEDPVPHAGGLRRPGGLEGHVAAVVADDGVGGLVAGVVAEAGEALGLAAAVELELPEVDVLCQPWWFWRSHSTSVCRPSGKI